MSLINLQQLSPSAGVHLEAVSNGSALRLWTDDPSLETQSPILSSTCWTPCSSPTPSFWQIASSRIQIASEWLVVCFLHRPSLMTHRSGHLHHTRHGKPPAMGASPRYLKHVFSLVLLADAICWWGGWWGSPTCAGRQFRWRIGAGRCWPIDWIVSRWSWRHSSCTWRWQPLPLNLWRGEHLRATITTLVDVIFLPLWPITWISWVCTGGWVLTMSCVEWRMVMKLRSAWKWLLWRQVTIPMWQMILIGLFPKLTVLPVAVHELLSNDSE